MSLVAVNWNPTHRQLRQFGTICLVAFSVLGMLIYVRHSVFRIPLDIHVSHAIGISLYCFGTICALIAIVAPPVLRPLYAGLTLITLPIGYVVSFVILAVMFYGVITPIGLFMRLIGRDTMQRKLRPDLPSYWEPRQTETDMQRYFRQS